MSLPVRFGIWGLGAVAHDVVQDMPLAGVVPHAVASRSLERARAFAGRHGIARAGQGLEFLLADPEVDVVYIATPHSTHAADATACLHAGKPVLVEKPFATNATEAAAVVALARERGLFCMEAMWSRFVPAVAAVRERLVAGEIGAVRSVCGEFAYPAVLDPKNRLFDPAAGGGALLDRGVYLVSLLQHWLGSPQVTQALARIGSTGVDEDVACLLGWPARSGGAVAHVAASVRVRGTNSLTVHGETGSLHLPAPFYRAHRLEISPEPVATPVLTAPHGTGGWKARLKASPTLGAWRRRLDLVDRRPRAQVLRLPFPGHGYQFELAEVARCLRGGEKESQVMPLADTVAVMRALDSLRESLDAMRESP
jgi:predicted dehydrogenase